MCVIVSALEHSRVPLEVREPLSFTRATVSKLTKEIARMPGVSGCVLLSTCNRTELYISAPEDLNPGELLCRAAEVSYLPFEGAFETFKGADAVRHLMEVSAGLRSRIFGEDQIVAQIKDAVLIAREQHAADGELETLFRTAISAGKEVRSRVRFSVIPPSAPASAVSLLREQMGLLAGMRALVIGNGEMGRMTARLLCREGCKVLVTLRSYRHGQAEVPTGCRAISYDDRFTCLNQVDFLVSATISPHYTISREALLGINNPPRVMVDLALPRDIDPEIAVVPGVRIFNIDDLSGCAPNEDVPPLAQEIIGRWEGEFRRWKNYRACIPSVEQLKQAVRERVLTDQKLLDARDPQQAVCIAADRTVELLMGRLSGCVTPKEVTRCSQKIRARTRAKHSLNTKKAEDNEKKKHVTLSTVR